MYLKIIKNLSFYLNKEKRKLLNFIPRSKTRLSGVRPKISAYLTIYNDADILDMALKSVLGYVDELIVVDGAYEWMAPFLRSTGRNPLKSDDIIYQKIQASGIPYKVINKIWKNEIEKRIAGFDAASLQYVMRIDADEVLMFDDAALDGYFASSCAVAEMYMPNYVAPGWVIQGTRIIDRYRTYPRQSMLFDRNRISSSEHLTYLWLVLTADHLPADHKKQKIFPVYEIPIAFCAHLTSWRYVESSATRSSFYIMNWMRQNGAPWINEFGNNKIQNFDKFFKIIPPHIFLEVMRGGIIVQGDIHLKPLEKLSKTPLTEIQEKSFVTIYFNFLQILRERAFEIKKNGSFALSGYSFFVDISIWETIGQIAPSGILRLVFSESTAVIDICLRELSAFAPFNRKKALRFDILDKVLSIDLRSIVEDGSVLRRSLEINVNSVELSKPYFKYQIVD